MQPPGSQTAGTLKLRILLSPALTVVARTRTRISFALGTGLAHSRSGAPPGAVACRNHRSHCRPPASCYVRLAARAYAWRSPRGPLPELPGSASPSTLAGEASAARLNPLDDEPDAERELPDELREDPDHLPHGARLDDPEHRGGRIRTQHRTRDEPQHGQAPRHQAGSVHQVAQQHPVPDADDEAGPERERPSMHRDERRADREERAGIRARGLLPQRHDRQHAEDADGDEDALDDTRRDPAEGGDFAHPLEDREQHDGAADIRDDEEQLQVRPPGHARVSPGADDVARVAHHGGVVVQERGDRGEIRDQEEYARDERQLSLRSAGWLIIGPSPFSLFV